ncbi:Transposase protein [Popillia japonica]|uniref:Transposase protein n=1 Tax=Popillia japonica TaxID=7064 RepID=A0AAW1IGG3_POPJA
MRRKKKLCSEHFSDRSFRTAEKVALNYNAVPSILHTVVVSRHEPNDLAIAGPSGLHDTFTLCEPCTAESHVLNPAEIKLSLVSIKNRKIQKALCKKRKNTIKALRNRDMKGILNDIIKGCNNEVSFNLLLTQIKFKNRKPQGRRWTTKEKAVALSIYKRSPKAYRLLQCFMPLPSRATLISTLSSVPFTAGICTTIFNHLRKCVKNMQEEDRICSLIFDEMSLKQHLEYDVKNDRSSGFEDFGTERGNKYSNTALVFLIQGLRKNWKQPVAFYLVNSKMESSKKKCIAGKNTLDYCIKEVAEACIAIRLKIVATVCDMGANNLAALQQLGFTFIDPRIEISGTVIYVFFDPPHLHT